MAFGIPEHFSFYLLNLCCDNLFLFLVFVQVMETMESEGLYISLLDKFQLKVGFSLLF